MLQNQNTISCPPAKPNLGHFLVGEGGSARKKKKYRFLLRGVTQVSRGKMENDPKRTDTGGGHGIRARSKTSKKQKTDSRDRQGKPTFVQRTSRGGAAANPGPSSGTTSHQKTFRSPPPAKRTREEPKDNSGEGKATMTHTLEKWSIVQPH